MTDDGRRSLAVSPLSFVLRPSSLVVRPPSFVLGRSSFVLLVVVLALLLLACVPSQPPERLVRLGLVAPFSGRDYAVGLQMLFGSRLAVREWNERGGLAGRRIELVALGEGTDGHLSREQAAKLALDPGVVTAFGFVDGPAARQAAEAVATNALPLLALGDPGPSADDRVYRFGRPDEEVAAAMVQTARSRLGARRVAIVGAARTAQPPVGLLARAAPEAGLDVALERAILPERTDFAELAGQVVEARVEVLLLAAPHDTAHLLPNVDRLGPLPAVVAGPQMAAESLLQVAGPAARGALYLSLALDPRDRPDLAAFRVGYQQLAGSKPGAWAVLGYEAADRLLTTAARAAPAGGAPDRRSLAAALSMLPGRSSGSGGIYRLESDTFPGSLIGRW